MQRIITRGLGTSTLLSTRGFGIRTVIITTENQQIKKNNKRGRSEKSRQKKLIYTVGVRLNSNENIKGTKTIEFNNAPLKVFSVMSENTIKEKEKFIIDAKLESFLIKDRKIYATNIDNSRNLKNPNIEIQFLGHKNKI